MDYEKKYNEALERAKTLYENANGMILKKWVEQVFPELKESEDEKIRKGLIDFVNQYGDNFYGQISKEYAIAWLEKQGEKPYGQREECYDCQMNYGGTCKGSCAMKRGEQKPADKVEHKRMTKLEDKLSSLVVNAVHIYCKENELDTPHYVGLILGDRLAKEWSQDILTLAKDELKMTEQKPVPKFEVGDVMRTLQEAADNITSGLPVVVSIDDEYYRCNNELIAIKDQDDYEYPPMNRIQKPAWREEDEKEVAVLKAYICSKEWSERHVDRALGIVDELVNKVKSPRPQSTWKPSDEQIGALEHFVRSIAESGFASPYDSNTKLVYSLFNDLKKLREE